MVGWRVPVENFDLFRNPNRATPPRGAFDPRDRRREGGGARGPAGTGRTEADLVLENRRPAWSALPPRSLRPGWMPGPGSASS